LPTPSIAIAGVALFIALGGSAFAARGLIHARNIAPGAVTGKAIRNGAVEPRDLGSATRGLLARGGARGETGPSGTSGANGANGPNGANGTNGVDGANGANGPSGANGTNGVDGTNGPNGANGVDGTNGTNGVDGAPGTNGVDGAPGTNGVDGAPGTNGVDGTITPLSATAGSVALPTGSPLTAVVSLAVPVGSYVVLAKTELSHTGAGDTVECVLKAGAATVDQIAMKTLPALAAIPASLQAVVEVTSPSQLSLECQVAVANGSANFSSLIAIPTG